MLQCADSLNYTAMPLYLECSFSVTVKEKSIHPIYLWWNVLVKCQWARGITLITEVVRLFTFAFLFHRD